jgi:hypothetical protein
MQMLAQRIEKRRSHVELQEVFPAVDGQFHVRGKIRTLCKGRSLFKDCLVARFGFGNSHISPLSRGAEGTMFVGWQHA